MVAHRVLYSGNYRATDRRFGENITVKRFARFKVGDPQWNVAQTKQAEEAPPAGQLQVAFTPGFGLIGQTHSSGNPAPRWLSQGAVFLFPIGVSMDEWPSRAFVIRSETCHDTDPQVSKTWKSRVQPFCTHWPA